ncbi:hypothetical protein GXM_10434 [Nostoc sphaeroides CCNUC1]|uniref:Uncharacterized protein n=1 Tax=Nostoc sphaeroides CCNUC1 TaxID=2653204 RepID=A0A5P8WLB6_9NOSO|nr:hypothetical protein GXM_10434 [Nostoc sphaeroides CCNUC1]
MYTTVSVKRRDSGHSKAVLAECAKGDRMSQGDSVEWH